MENEICQVCDGSGQVWALKHPTHHDSAAEELVQCPHCRQGIRLIRIREKHDPEENKRALTAAYDAIVEALEKQEKRK